MRRPVWILHVFVVGLALHNLAMSLLWQAGLRGTALELVSAWKEALLALGLVLVLRAHGSRRFRPRLLDWLALAYGAVVVVYGLLPQHWLGGAATHRGVLLGRARGPAAGRLLLLRARARCSVAATCARLAGTHPRDAPAAWRSSGSSTSTRSRSPGGARAPARPAGSPTSSASPTARASPTCPRTSSTTPATATPCGASSRPSSRRSRAPTCSSPRLLLATAWRLRLRAPLRLWLPTVALLAAGLLWTHSRSSYIALALGLVVIAWAAARLAAAAPRRGRR